ncbi:MAG TPA: hypothetical protein VK788_22900 [Terriglobales bacterium]|jgi:hypothetical protein|nr:hypothetical protein [Terriglobales bacterium]
MLKSALLGGMLSVGLLFGGLLYAQGGGQTGGMKPPAENVSGKRHPNLAAAQRLCDQAFEKIQTAQQANEFDMDGHAQHAKELLDQASHELKQAAVAANKNHK